MSRSDAGRGSPLESYLSQLEAELAAVSSDDRREILMETRSHVLERTQRMTHGDVAHVLSELGPPERYARQFLPDASTEPMPSPHGTLLQRLLGVATRGWHTLPLFLLVVGGYFCAALAFLLAIGKIVEPNATGLFVDHANGRRQISFVWSEPNPRGRDVLGLWFVPIMFGISVAIHLGVSTLLARVMRKELLSRALFVLALLMPGVRSVDAQQSTGIIEGVARSDDDGAPISFALVRVQRSDGRDTATVQQGVTTAMGRFRFAELPAATYRLQLLRIGYRPVLSPPIPVVAGETVKHDFRVATLAVQLAAVVVHPEGTCLTADRLGADPRLATLWMEARKGVEIRRAFELQYRFTRVVTQNGRIKLRLGSKRLHRSDTVVNIPDSVLAREARRRAAGRTSGYGTGTSLVLPDEKELLHEEFLHDHCFETSVASADGALGLRFRSVRTRDKGNAIRGVLWIDASTYMIRRLDIEWLDGKRVAGESRIEYAELPVAGGTLRLPSSGRATARPGGATRVAVSRADVTIEFTYSDFRTDEGPRHQELGDQDNPDLTRRPGGGGETEHMSS